MLANMGCGVEPGVGEVEVDMAVLIETAETPRSQFVKNGGRGIGRAPVEKTLENGEQSMRPPGRARRPTRAGHLEQRRRRTGGLVSGFVAAPGDRQLFAEGEADEMARDHVL